MSDIASLFSGIAGIFLSPVANASPETETVSQPPQTPTTPNTIQPLTLGDHDLRNNRVRYNGIDITPQNNQSYTEVDTLQENLRTIGLDEIAGVSDGDYGSRTAIAVAIFQGFALVKTRDDATNNVMNPINFNGQVSGNADAHTRSILRRYVNENIALPVQTLEARLQTLGFASLIEPPNTNYTWDTYFAMREFQIFCKMDNLSQAPQNINNTQPLSDQYQQVANNELYIGPVNGVLDVTTDECMSYWIDNRLRCPLIFEAWNMQNGNRNTLNTENFWRHDEMTNTGPRVFAHDLSDYYTLPAARQNETRTVVGGYSNWPNWGGQSSKPQYDHTWSPETEFLPENCIGNNWNALTAAEQSTFRTIRTVCERESLGYLDCMNAYDSAVVSAGPYHWTICLLDDDAPHPPSNGELMALIAMLRDNHLAEYEAYFEFYGVRPTTEWGNNGQVLFNSSQHKYSDWISFQISDNDYVKAPKLMEIGNYFRIWHWFYRIQMMCRLSTDLQEEMWIYTRMRIRDIKDTAWDGNATVDDGAGGTRLATIGDYYTSEKALAMITRWHVWRPNSMVSNGRAGDHLTEAFANTAGLNGDPSTWTDANEQALITALMNRASNFNNNLGTGLQAIDTWPASMPQNWNLTLDTNAVGDISADRNSLDFDDTDLPTRAF